MRIVQSIEQKLLAASRVVILLLATLMLICAVWWAALSLPSIWQSDRSDASRVNAAQDFKLDEQAYSAAVLTPDGVDFDETTRTLHQTMREPEVGKHYDSIIRTIRSYARNPERQAVRAQRDDGGSEATLAPRVFEDIDKYSRICGDSLEINEKDLLDDDQTGDATGVADAAVSAAGTVDASTYCGTSTVRGIIVDRLTSLLWAFDAEQDKAKVHKAYISGLDASVGQYFKNKNPAVDLISMNDDRLATALVDAYTQQFSSHLDDAAIASASRFERLAKSSSPMTLLMNPFVAGTLGFLALFAYVMVMFSFTRIERNLRLNNAAARAPSQR